MYFIDHRYPPQGTKAGFSKTPVLVSTLSTTGVGPIAHWFHAYVLSVISESELLAYPGLASLGEELILDLLSDIPVTNLTQSIKQHAMNLRKRFGLKLSDAIVAATALARPGACPTLTLLLRQTIRDQLRPARPEKILNVFQRIRLRFFRACGLTSGRASFALSRRQCRTGS